MCVWASSCVTQHRPWPRVAFKFSKLAYQLSNVMHPKLRSVAVARMARKWSFLICKSL